jgi:hypothetical protein
MTPEQARKLEEVYNFMKNMENQSTIPNGIYQALKARLGL